MKDWMKHPKFKEILKGSWVGHEAGNYVIHLFKKLKRSKDLFRKLNKQKFSDISGRVELARTKLECAQADLINDLANTQLQDIVKSARETYIIFLTFEESFFKEKSRIKWIKEGDKNISFFHITVKLHNARNKNLRLQNEEGL